MPACCLRQADARVRGFINTRVSSPPITGINPTAPNRHISRTYGRTCSCPVNRALASNYAPNNAFNGYNNSAPNSPINRPISRPNMAGKLSTIAKPFGGSVGHTPLNYVTAGINANTNPVPGATGCSPRSAAEVFVADTAWADAREIDSSPASSHKSKN